MNDWSIKNTLLILSQVSLQNDDALLAAHTRVALSQINKMLDADLERLYWKNPKSSIPVYPVRWHTLNETKPDDDLFYSDLWIYTGERIQIARWIGDRPYVCESGTAAVDGFIRGGWWFDRVTHWAYIVHNKPLPPID